VHFDPRFSLREQPRCAAELIREAEAAEAINWPEGSRGGGAGGQELDGGGQELGHLALDLGRAARA
jgi:hypothetical protein